MTEQHRDFDAFDRQVEDLRNKWLRHRAKPEVWARVESYGNKDEKDMLNCVLELRSRVKALEAAAKPAESNYPAEPDSSLGEWVADALDETLGGSDAQARAVLLAIAAWLRQRDTYVRASVQIAGVLERAANQHSS